MKIAIAAANNNPEARIDGRFGRAKYFAVFNDENGTCEFASNTQNLSLPQGAGIQAAKNVLKTGAAVLIAKNIGPKAFELLRQSGIAMYLCEEEIPLKEAIERFKSGTLTKCDSATAEDHW
jgi:predicted Fe-Mo cluster-binding NifX family protein